MIDLDAIKARTAERTHTMETMPVEADVDALIAEVERLTAERQATINASPAAKARAYIPSLTMTDTDLVRHAIESAGRLEYRMRRVSAVDAALNCGDGVAAALCRAIGLDPDEMVGTDGEGEE